MRRTILKRINFERGRRDAVRSVPHFSAETADLVFSTDRITLMGSNIPHSTIIQIHSKVGIMSQDPPLEAQAQAHT